MEAFRSRRRDWVDASMEARWDGVRVFWWGWREGWWLLEGGGAVER